MRSVSQTSSKWRSPFPIYNATILVLVVLSHISNADHEEGTKTSNPVYGGKFNITYYEESAPSKPQVVEKEMGNYAINNAQSPVEGRVVLAMTRDNKTTACGKVVNEVDKKWIALVQRGTCNFTDKMKNVKEAGALGIIIYNNRPEKDKPHTIKAGKQEKFLNKRNFDKRERNVNNHTII